MGYKTAFETNLELTLRHLEGSCVSEIFIEQYWRGLREAIEKKDTKSVETILFGNVGYLLKEESQKQQCNGMDSVIRRAAKKCENEDIIDMVHGAFPIKEQEREVAIDKHLERLESTIGDLVREVKELKQTQAALVQQLRENGLTPNKTEHERISSPRIPDRNDLTRDYDYKQHRQI